MQTKPNITARMGRWSATHKKTAILGWLLFVVLAVVVGGNVGTESLKQEESGVGASGQASKITSQAFPDHLEESVLIQNKGLTAEAPQFHDAVEDVRRRLTAVDGVRDLHTPYDANAPSSISKDEHSVLVTFEIRGELTDPKVTKVVDATVAATASAAKANPEMLVEQFGDGSSEKAFTKIFDDDLAKAGSISLPITLAILLVTFGTLLAAGVPLLLAITGVMATMGLVGPISQLAPVEDSIQHVILLIGLAVGVDYSLFYLRRVREERAAGRGKDAAIEAAAATSGRAVLISGITVMVSMAGMYLAGAPTFTSFATGTVLVVAVSIIGSLTVLPAVLAGLGGWIDKGNLPGLRRVKARTARIGLWPRIVDRVLRRPLIAATLAVGVLVALAIPATQMELGTPPLKDSLPQDQPVVQTFNRVTAAFPIQGNGLEVVVKAGDVTSPAVADGIASLERAIAARPDLFPGKDAPEVNVSPDKTVATVEIEVAGEARDDISYRALDELRDDIIPATLDSVGGTTTLVDGVSAQERDLNDTMKSHMPLVLAFVLGAAFLLLLVTFRSIVIPIKAIILNLLSVAASYGAMVLVFQHGWFKEQLGFDQTGPITAWLPMFMFVVLFGLSMDYHVFILSRVREAYDKGMKTEAAVSYAIKNTAGVVTSAAFVMVAVFAIFGSLTFIVFKQMGVGLAFAVLLDATIIRGVLLPASMKLLGDWNWYLPRSLGWLPKVQLEEEVAPATA